MQCVYIEKKRIEVVKTWHKPQSMQDIQIFIKFIVNFIWSFSKIAALLIFIFKSTLPVLNNPLKSKLGINNEINSKFGNGTNIVKKFAKSKNKKIAKSKNNAKTLDFSTSKASVAFI